jgi:undecaprenyl diphosphate synthase
LAKAPSKQKVDNKTTSEKAQAGAALPLEHVAIIMDGNRRWAADRNQPRVMGHKAGVQTLKQLVRHVGRLRLKFLTVYAFSSENWQRSKEEVGFLLDLFQNVLMTELEELAENDVKLTFLGDLEQLPDSLQTSMRRAMEKTRANTGLALQVAINYGSRLEITEAVKKIAAELVAGRIQIEEITDDLISSFLYTRGIPDPALLIRTGGEMRLSNYLLWQAAYTELYVTPTLWPDFNPDEFDQAIIEFQSRQRRWGT